MSGVGSKPWVIRGNVFHTRRERVPVLHATSWVHVAHQREASDGISALTPQDLLVTS